MSHFTRTQIEDIFEEVLNDDSTPNDNDLLKFSEKRIILHEVRHRLAGLEALGLAPHLIKKERNDS